VPKDRFQTKTTKLIT